MHSAHRVVFIGFSSFERSTLESYFRLASAHDGGYEIIPNLNDSDLVVADADLPDAVLTVGRAGRVRDTIFIGGAAAPTSAAAHLTRPINAIQVMRALDTMAQRRPARPCGRARQQDVDARQRVGDFHTSSVYSNSVLVEGESRLDEVLVVSASPAERQVLRDMLSRFGYGVTLARSTDDAVRMCDEKCYGFVFLGLGQDGIDGFQASRRIKHRPTPTGVAPVIVALAHRTGAIDRIRATFAGFDAYLTTPLDESELLRVLAQHDRTFERVFEPTAPLQH
jgi:two-component system, cell cycle response regulator